jgi:hypothetical protein
MDNEFNRRLYMSGNFSKVGVILLLLLLLLGPVLQVLDCFNDAPNLDHDGVLHGVDALLCFAFTLLIFSCLLLAFLKLLRLSQHLTQQLTVSFGGLCPILPFLPSDTSPTSPLALRI